MWSFLKSNESEEVEVMYPSLNNIPLEDIRKAVEEIIGGNVIISKTETEVDGPGINLVLTFKLNPPTVILRKEAVDG